MKKFFAFFVASFVALTMNAQVYNVAEAIAAANNGTIATNDSIAVRGVITKIEFKGRNFARYGSANIYVNDITGAEGSFEFYNCYSLEADTFRTSVPAYDANSTAWAQFTQVTDGNGITIYVGDTVIGTGKYTLYNTTHELNTGCYISSIIKTVVPPTPPVSEALTVAEAYAIGMTLDSMATSEDEYTVEGYVINAGTFSTQYMNQSWYMADDANASASDFQAYHCYPIQGDDTLKVLNGDKVSLTGRLKKYYNQAEHKYIIEFDQANATFLQMVSGDHSVVSVVEEISVARALEIGSTLADGAMTERRYKIRGYVSAINVKSNDAWSDQHMNQSFWIMDTPGSGSTNADGAFYVYRGKPNTGAAVAVGDYVEFTCTIKKYVPNNGVAIIENNEQNIVVNVLDNPVVPTTCTVSFINGLDDSTIASGLIQFELPAAPQIAGFTFVGWQAECDGFITDELVIVAIYEVNEPSNAPAVYTNPANPTQKLIRNGNVYILHGDKTYTVNGQEVK